jgi:hypothetical protein
MALSSKTFEMPVDTVVFIVELVSVTDIAIED